MKNLKRMVSAILVATFATGIIGVTASAAKAPNSADWKVSAVNIQGAPSSESTSVDVTISQRNEGATAHCTGCENVYETSASGYTYIKCVSYSMQEQKITNIGSAALYPSVGDPKEDIEVTYHVYATTPARPNAYWSWGYIERNDPDSTSIASEIR